MLQKKDRIEIVVPVYNEESCLGSLLNRLVSLKKKMDYVETEFIFVNDGSSDNSLQLLNDNAGEYGFIKIINLSRNFGHQLAVTAGLDYATADYVVIIDADLQDPPECIEGMYQKAKEGYDVVFGRRLIRKGESFLKEFTAKVFYKLLSKLCDVEIPTDVGDFRLINNKVLKALKEMRERHRFIRGMVPWVGFKSIPLNYHRDKRFAGNTKYPLRKMLRFALDAIFSFSNVPLKIASYVGFSIVFFSVFGGLILLYLRLFTSLSVPGITAVILTVIIMGGIQIIMLGIVGEYVGRIFEESKKRPLYIIKDSKNFDIKHEI